MKHLLSYLITASLVLTASLTANAKEEQEAEALAVRRIVSFFEAGEYAPLRQEVHHFLKRYPKSHFTDRLQQLLGDAEYSLGHWEKACAAYAAIRSKESLAKCVSRYAHALAQTDKWTQLLRLTRSQLSIPLRDEENPVQQELLFLHVQALLQEGAPSTERQQAADALSTLLKRGPHTVASALLAALYGSLNQKAKAIALYEEQALRSPQDKASLLYQAALLQKDENPEKALEKLREVQSCGDCHAGDAAFLEAALLVQGGHYADLLAASSRICCQLSPSQRPILDYFLGYSYSETHKLTEAVSHLSRFVSEEKDSPYDEMAFLLLIRCFEQQGDARSAQRYLTTFEQRFPTSASSDQVICLVASALEKEGRRDDALLLLERLLQDFPSSSQRSYASFKRATLLYASGAYVRSREAFLQFIKAFPDSTYTLQAYRYLPTLSLEALGKTQKPTATQVEEGIQDIQRALDTKGALKADEKPSFHLSLARLQLMKGGLAEASLCLKAFLRDYPRSTLLYQAHYLLAICGQKEGRYDDFAFHAEHVLLLHPKLEEAAALKKNLIAAYLYLSNDDPRYKERAAELLREQFRQAPEHVDMVSLVWLADYYYEKLAADRHPYLLEPSEYTEELAEALTMYQRIVELFTDDTAALDRERDSVRLARLLAWSGNFQGVSETLATLKEWQALQAEQAWNLSAETQFIRAYAAEQQELWATATSLFSPLTSDPRLKVSPLQAAAQLHHCRVAYRDLPDEKRHVKSREVQTILAGLHDLQMKRKLSQEPIHLEAAMDAAEIYAACHPPKEKEEALLQQLMAMKEDFSSKGDLWSKDYHSARSQFPEQDRIYQAYLMLVDARIAYLQLKLSRESDRLDMHRRAEAAHTILSTLLSGKFAVSRYVVDRAQANLDALEGEAGQGTLCEELPLKVPERAR